MKISFVVPAYNEEKNIAECVRAIKKEIERYGRWDDCEVIVVNNACTDLTAKLAQEAGAIVVNEQRKGLVMARRAGYLASKGELVANIDGDTLMPVGWLKKVLNEFEKDSDLVALSGPHFFYDLSPMMNVVVKFFYSIAYFSYLLNRFVLRIGSMLQGGNFIVRRSALEKIGGFDPEKFDFYGEDTDLARRLFKVGKVKWTFALPMLASGRRLKKEGIVNMALKYGLNYYSTLFWKKPISKKYIDIRY